MCVWCVNIHTMRKAKPLADRFWAKVHKTDGCWLWTASLGTHGYGQIGVGNTVKGAYRVAWELTFGPIPKGLSVCHRCDNPKCVRPSHLFIATQAGNLRDMTTKGRRRSSPNPGERNGNHRLTATNVAAIRRRHAAGESLRALGHDYGVWHTTIADIVKRRTWRE
jgi:hypothetical protein